MELIALSGYARSGKDEAAKVMVEEFGFKRVAFADKLRDVLYQLNPLVGFEEYYGDSFDRYVQDVIDQYGWDGYKETEYGVEIRRLLQRLGTEAGRNTLGENIWVDVALNNVEGDIVVTDCRFPNEAQAVKDRGGQIWRIRRKGVGPANSHASETSLDDWPWDVIIDNDGSLEDYHKKVRDTLQYVRL